MKNNVLRSVTYVVSLIFVAVVAQGAQAQQKTGSAESLSLAVMPKDQASAKSDTAVGTTRNTCGWWDNPTPANVWFTDREGQWTVSIQGMHSAEGDWPKIKDSQKVRTNRSYGYGCACLKVDVDAESREVSRIYTAQARALSLCRKDKHLKKLEPSRGK